MYATLIFQLGISAVPLNHKDNFLAAANPTLVQIHHINFPSLRFRILLIHAEQFCREKRSLIPARTRADLNNYVLLIIRIFREQQNFNLLL